MIIEFFKTIWGRTLGTLAVLVMLLQIYNEAVVALTNTYQMQIARADAAIKKQDADVLTSPSPVMGEAEAWKQLCEVEKADSPLCKHKPSGD